MLKRVVVSMLAVGLLVSFGCGKKADKGAAGAKGAAAATGFSCKSACERIAKCSDAISDAMSEGMPEAAKVQMRTAMKKEMGDVAKCTKHCDSDMKKNPDSKETNAIKGCMPKSDCKAFAACFKVVISKPKPKPVDEKTPHAGPSAPNKGPTGPTPR